MQSIGEWLLIGACLSCLIPLHYALLSRLQHLPQCSIGQKHDRRTCAMQPLTMHAQLFVGRGSSLYQHVYNPLPIM